MAVVRPERDGQVPDRSSPEKLIGLEGLRFVAAFAVLVWHYQHFFFIGGTAPGFVSQNQPFFGALELFYVHGEYGVHLFWCISGFIFAWKYNAGIGAGEVAFGRFAVLRFSRLYPLHFATLLAVAVLQWIHWRTHGSYFVYETNDVKHFILNLAFASYWGLQDDMSFNGPSWSISAEVLVYLLFFGQCRLAGTRAALSLALAFGMFLVSMVATPLASRGFAVPVAVAYFCLGVLTSHCYALIAGQGRAVRLAAGSAVLVVACVLLMRLNAGQLNVMTFPAVVLLFQLAIPDRHAGVNRLLSYLGDMTYASYLLHFPVQLAMVMAIDGMGPHRDDLVSTRMFFVTYIVSVCVLSRIVFRGLERPAQDFLRRALRRRPMIATWRDAASPTR